MGEWGDEVEVKGIKKKVAKVRKSVAGNTVDCVL